MAILPFDGWRQFVMVNFWSLWQNRRTNSALKVVGRMNSILIFGLSLYSKITSPVATRTFARRQKRQKRREYSPDDWSLTGYRPLFLFRFPLICINHQRTIVIYKIYAPDFMINTDLIKFVFAPEIAYVSALAYTKWFGNTLQIFCVIAR